MKFFMQKILNTLNLIAFLTIVNSCSDALSNNSKTELMTKGSTTLKYKLGRFSFNMPKDFSLKIENHTIDYISFKEVIWEVQKKWQQEASKIVKQRVEEINKEFYPPEGRENVVIDIITDNKKHTTSIIYYNDEADQETINIEMFYANSTTGVWLSTFGYESNQKELINELKTIQTKYFNDEKSKPLSKLNHYFLRGGVSFSEPDDEEMFIAFENSKYALSIETKMNDKEISDSLFKNTGRISRFINFLKFGIRQKVIRKQNKTVANINGQELIMQIKEKGKPQSYYFIFKAHGKLNNHLFPNIILEFDSNKSSSTQPDFNEMEQIWNQFLNSLTLN